MARLVWVFGAFSALLLCGCHHRPEEVSIFAAASTSDAISDLARAFEAKSGVKVLCVFGGSAALARQIESGARADLYLSASPEWMDDLERKGLLEPGTRGDLLGNQLVWVAPATAASPPEVPASRPAEFSPGQKPPVAGDGRIAVADPAYVPAGKYARQALERLGWWATLRGRMITTPDVRAALRLVELGEVAGGIVYASDAVASSKVKVVGTFAPDTHEPIRYPLARCRNAHPKVADFQRYLLSPEAAEVFRRYGFVTGAASTRSTP